MDKKKKYNREKEVYKKTEKTTDKYRNVSVASEDYAVNITSCFENDSRESMTERAEKIMGGSKKKKLDYIT